MKELGKKEQKQLVLLNDLKSLCADRLEALTVSGVRLDAVLEELEKLIKGE
jgi:hypothetical protein